MENTQDEEKMYKKDHKEGGKKGRKVVGFVFLIVTLAIVRQIGGSIGEWAANNRLEREGLNNNTNLSTGNDKTNSSTSKMDSVMTDTEKENKIIYLEIPDSFQKVENDTCIEYYEYADNPDAAYISLTENSTDYSQSELILYMTSVTSEEFGTAIQEIMEDSLNELGMEGVSVNTEMLNFSKEYVCDCTAVTGVAKTTLSHDGMDTTIYTYEMFYITDKMYIWTLSDYSGGALVSSFSDIMESAYLADYQE